MSSNLISSKLASAVKSSLLLAAFLLSVGASYANDPDELQKITFLLDGQEISADSGISYDDIRSAEFQGELKYIIDSSVAEMINKRSSKITMTIVSKGRQVTTRDVSHIYEKGKIKAWSLLRRCKRGDVLIIELTGVPQDQGIPKITTFRIG